MILLDANFLLEMLLPGRPKQKEVFEWFERNQESFCISMLTVHLVLHFGIKESKTLGQLEEFLADYPKVALIPADYLRALKVLKDSDHEDALQLAVAERAGCDAIATLDRKFARNYGSRINFVVI